MIRHISIRAAGVAALVAVLGGCALLKTPPPVQMYRFGGDVTEASAVVGADPIEVDLRRVEFPQAARGDKILGLTGSEAAYVGGARWVSPAEELYGASLEQAFISQASSVRLIGRRELVRASRSLDVDVQAFEARYDAPGAAPTVVVSARARLLQLPDRGVTAEQVFTVRQPADANRVSSIVDAFDVATRDLNTQIVAWTEANAGITLPPEASAKR